MARTVIRNALFFGKAKFSSLILPWCTYTSPEVAHVGLYESDLAGSKYSVFQKHFKDLDRAILDGETNGYIKVIVKEGSDQIVGCTIVAANAGDMISEVTLAMTNRIGLGGIAATIHPYPTQADVIRHTADMYNRTRLTPIVRALFRKLMSARR